MASRSWPEVQGTVLESEVVPATGESSRDEWSPRVRYRYEVGGAAIENDVIWPGGGKSGSRPWADELVAGWAPGAAVVVHHDPDDPRVAVLLPGDLRRGWLTVVFGLGLFGAGLWAVVRR